MEKDKKEAQKAIQKFSISRMVDEIETSLVDLVTKESPLEINVTSGNGANRNKHAISITMRTPGQDIYLALGFLYSEGLIHSYDNILKIERPSTIQSLIEEQTVHVHLKPEIYIDKKSLLRHFYTTSSCGVCGKASLDLVKQQVSFVLAPHQPKVQLKELYKWPGKMRKMQSLFAQTGSIHAAGLFDTKGNLLYCCEDVGRHNALDKLIGLALEANNLPWQDKIVFLSGRISFELVQKALMAGVPVVAAVGAPSSLAIELADAHGMTLIGFLKNNSCNIYCGPQRILSQKN